MNTTVDLFPFVDHSVLTNTNGIEYLMVTHHIGDLGVYRRFFLNQIFVKFILAALGL
jgi:hypothetical protein